MHRVFVSVSLPLGLLACLMFAIKSVLAADQSLNDRTSINWLDQVQQALNTRLRAELQNIANNMHLSHYETGLNISYIDPRMNLVPCSSLPEVEIPHPIKIGRSHIKVSCAQPSAWAINVPVDLKVMTDVLVLSRPVGRGAIIQKQDLKTQFLDLGSLNNGYFLRKELVIGKQSKRALAANTVMIPHYLLPALMVKKGDSVMITAQKGSMVVKMSGEALNDGREGRQIRVKNNRSQRIVKARVVAPGIVKVDL